MPRAVSIIEMGALVVAASLLASGSANAHVVTCDFTTGG